MVTRYSHDARHPLQDVPSAQLPMQFGERLNSAVGRRGQRATGRRQTAAGALLLSLVPLPLLQLQVSQELLQPFLRRWVSSTAPVK